MENPFQTISNDLKEIKFLLSNLGLLQTKEEPEADITDLKGAAKILNNAPATIYNKVSRKEIPHFKKGKKLYFSKSGLITWLKEGKKLTLTEIENEVNETLYKQKKGIVSIHRKQTISKFDSKNNTFNLKERVKKFTDTAEIENQTPEEASEEAGQLHYIINEEELNKIR